PRTSKSYYYEEDDIPQPNNPRFDPSLTTIESRHQQSDNRIFVGNTSKTKYSPYFQGESSDIVTPKNLKFDPSLKTLTDDHIRENTGDDINEQEIEDNQMNNGIIMIWKYS
ncbi:MAG: hypothetical protein EZS28_050341, partial [Streblomastix strix]